MLKAEFDRKMTELQAEYQRNLHEVQAEHTSKATKLQTSKNFIIMNKLLTNAFLSKCTSRMESHPSAAPRGKSSNKESILVWLYEVIVTLSFSR